LASLEIILEIGKRHVPFNEKEELASVKNRWYVEYISRMTPEEILPGALDFINELKKNNIRIALGSASKNTPMILERVGMTTLFEAVADGNIVNKAKPDPEVFIKAAEMLGTEPSRCVVFEDAVAGVEAALRAGMSCVGIGSPDVLGHAHMVVKGLYEMNIEKLKILEKQLGYE
jgi:beta-phosphoglucomutase